MPAIEPLYRLLGINPSKLTRIEITLLEAHLFSRIYKELKEFFRKQHREYFYLMKFTHDMENLMLESNFLRLILKDILDSKEYTPAGIAAYTDIPIDVIQEVIDGRNTNPSAKLLRRSIELHQSIRPELYEAILKKVIDEYLGKNN